jgi:hypothetical protein
MRLGLVTQEQMLTALVAAVETPVSGLRIIGVREIASAVEPDVSAHGFIR